MSKIIAIDFGLKRTGLAITDESKVFAFGHETIDSNKLMDYLKTWFTKEKIDCIVLGFPKRLNNEDSHITQNVRLLKEALEKQFPSTNIEIMDERFTSKMASESLRVTGQSKKVRSDKGLIDTVSATIILQSYLDAQSSRSLPFK